MDAYFTRLLLKFLSYERQNYKNT
jgi:hypothetical protein